MAFDDDASTPAPNAVALIRICGGFAVLSPLTIFAGIPIAAGLGGVGGPGPIDFGSPEVLVSLRAGQPATIWLDLLALIGPVLALPAGVGWYHLLRRASSLTLLAVTSWYIGMVFVITQDALQLALVTTLPDLHAAAADTSKAAIEAFGASMAYAIKVLAAVSAGAQAVGLPLLCVVMLRSAMVPKWIGALGLVSIGTIIGAQLLAWALPKPTFVSAGVPLGYMLLMTFILATGVLMIRWRPDMPRNPSPLHAPAT